MEDQISSSRCAILPVILAPLCVVVEIYDPLEDDDVAFSFFTT